MAIYHLHVGIGKRSKGDSAGAKFDYVFRQGKYANQDKAGNQKDYLDRQGDHEGNPDEVLFSHSGNMPLWAARNPRNYWQAVDNFERKNGVLFISIEFALPVEISDTQRQFLAVKYADLVSQNEGGARPYSLAIHRGKGHNPHCHLIISERINDGVERGPTLWFKRAANKGKNPAAGGARKASTGNGLGERNLWIERVRKMWADLHNFMLKKWKVETEEIDHRSYKRQGIDKIPGVHLGPYLYQKLRDGVTNKHQDLTIDEQQKVLQMIHIDKLNKDFSVAPNNEEMAPHDEGPRMG